MCTFIFLSLFHQISYIAAQRSDTHQRHEKQKFILFSLCYIGAATGAGSHKSLHFQPAALCGWEGAGQHVAALRPGHLHKDPARLQRQQPRRGLCQVSLHIIRSSMLLLDTKTQKSNHTTSQLSVIWIFNNLVIWQNTPNSGCTNTNTSIRHHTNTLLVLIKYLPIPRQWWFLYVYGNFVRFVLVTHLNLRRNVV